MSKTVKRFWEIDFLRGVAIILMIIIHIYFDLYYFLGYDINRNIWSLVGRSTAATFLLIVGISLTLSYSRIKDRKTNREIFTKYINRGLKILVLGFAITVVSFLFLEDAFVLFGILHLIGLSIIIAYPLVKFNYLNLFLGAGLITLGLYVRDLAASSNRLVWLGLRSPSYIAIDYFPLLPWFGVVLIGIFVGNILYKDYSRNFRIPDLSDNNIVKVFCFLGRKSLVIYLVHQPLLIIILYLMGIIKITKLALF